MRRRIWDIVIVLSLMAVVVGSTIVVYSAPPQPAKRLGKKNTVPPPKWDSRVMGAFFPDVLKEVGPGQPGAAAAVVRPSSGAPVTGSPGSAAPVGGAPVAGGFAWSTLIEGEVLESEIKSAINSLGSAVEVQGKFSQTYNKARRNFSVLAVMFGVVAAYDGDVKWKAKAAGLRDSLAKAGFNCKVGSPQAFSEAKARHEDLRQLLQGGSVNVPDAAADWGKLAELPELMKRMEEAGQNNLTPWTASQAEFKANKDKILHEAQVLAVLAQVIQHSSYELAGESAYLGYAGSLQKACLEITEGTRTDNYDKARTAAGSMAKSCASCHGDFK